MPRVLKGLCLALLAIGWQGCALELQEPDAESTTPLCFSDADCGQGEVCEASFCVVDTEIRELVAIQLTPSNVSDVLTEQFPVVELTQGDQLPDLQFQRPKLMQGMVTSQGSDADEPAQPINAQMIFRRTSPVIPGLTPHYQVSATRNNGYTQLLPNGVYEVTVLPENLELPPERIRQLPISADTIFDIVLEGRQNTTEVTGRLIYVDERIEEMEVVPGARISAIDENDARVSTIATTDEEGSFTINVRQSIEAVRLVLSPETEPFPLPRVITESIVLGGANITLGDLSLGVLHPFGRLVRGNLIGEVMGEEVSNTTIIFRGRVGEGVVVSTAATDSEGSFSVFLPPGSYNVQILPPGDSPHAISEIQNLRVPSVGNSSVAFEDIPVNPKTIIQGRAFSPEGDIALEGATVLLRSAVLSNSSDFEGDRVFSVRTDREGRYEARVDPGLYDVTLIPTDASGHARAFRYGIDITTEGTTEDLFADRSNLARGLVISPDNTPMTDILVEIFRMDSQQGSILIGSGLTNQNGEYRLLVPSLRLQ